MLGTIIVELGKAFPAFALDPDLPADRKRWLEAWLLIYEILDQSNHAGRGAGVSTDPLIIEILADRFLRFIRLRTVGLSEAAVLDLEQCN